MDPLAVAVAVLLGLYFGDFFSGLLHWTFDTWFSEHTRGLTRMVLIVREHHVHPQHIFRYGLKDEVGILSFAAWMPSADGGPWRRSFAV